jgi:LuxR family maltose regulon positive regulatory protein
VDADDNDPHRFLAGLAATLGPELGGGADAVLAVGGDGVLRRASTALVNAIADRPTPVVVVLDEWELITEPSVHAELEFLVERAPANLHLLLTTRHDPPIALSRLRARDLLAERGPAQLRFSAEEAARLLSGLAEETIAEVYRRTEGWPAGLRLLAASGDRVELPPRSGDGHVFAFLADEVFDRQSVDRQRFLVETSVLDTVSIAASAALTGRDDAADVLAELAARGLFITEWRDDVYRYHDLFRQFLLRRLARWPQERQRDVHRRAADAEREPVASARHLVAAGDPHAAAELLASVGLDLLRSGRAASVRDLLRELPESELERPELLALNGELAFADGDLATALDTFERAGTVTARLIDVLMLQGRAVEGDALIDAALVGPLDPAERVALLLTRARSAQITGQTEVAERLLAAGVAAATTRQAMVTAAAHLHGTLALIPHGAEHLERFTARAELEGLPGLQVAALRAVVDLLRGRLAEGLGGADRVRAEYRRYGGAPPFWTFLLLAMRLIGLGISTANLEPAIADLRKCASRLTEASFMYPNAWFMIGRAHWLRGQQAQARDALARMGGADSAPAGSAPLIVVNRLSLAGLVAIGDGDLRAAESALRASVEAEDAMPLVNIYGSARIRLAHVLVLRGRVEEALRVAEPALADAEATRTGGPILFEARAAESVLRLAAPTSAFAAELAQRLAELAAPQPIPVPGTDQTLTVREVEVLRLLAAGRTNREIAMELVLGDETIKTHVARVLRKLGAASRTSAVARARELGI